MADREHARRRILKLLATGAVASAVPGRLLAFGKLRERPEDLQAEPPASPVPVLAAHFDQVGYLPGFKKVVTVALEDTPGAEPRQLSDKLQTVQLTGIDKPERRFTTKLGTPVRDSASGDLVCQVDLSSAMSLPGRYRLQIGDSFNSILQVDPTVYQEALRLTMRSYYGQRCGIEVDLGGGYKHGRCHTEGLYNRSSGRTGKAASSGGWHDAGDYGRYVVNSGITTATLLWAWELYPEALRSLHLAIPESGGLVPDFLAEIRWNLIWMLSLQDPADGGVWHKQTSVRFCNFIMPEDDTLPSEVIGTGADPYKNTCATADLAAVMAIAARCFAPFDAPFSARCLTASRRAFAWCLLFPSVAFRNPAGVTTGEYGDRNCDDELLWAAAELFRTTGEKKFDEFVAGDVRPNLGNLTIATPSWSNVRSLGLWSYALARSANQEISSAVQASTKLAASALIDRSRVNGYGNTLSMNDFGWGSNSNAANQSLLLLIAHRFGAGQDALEAALGNLHYLLGRNCFGISWVTHVGTRSFERPHHRPSVADKIDKPWPGLLSGGPNAHGGDRVADALPASPPMRRWVDNDQAYSLNEVAINWNAPLVFMLAAFNSHT